MDSEKLRIIEETSVRYESEKKELENQELKKEAEVRKQIQLLLIVIGVILAALVVLLYILFLMKSRSLAESRQLKEKSELLQTLERQSIENEKQRLEELVFAEHKINQLQKEKITLLNQQISLTAMQMLSKTELLGTIQNRLEGFAGDEATQDTRIKEIRDLIGSNQSFDEDWTIFKKHFEEVNKGFFEKLVAMNAGITNHDMKLCAYIKVGLSGKEVARILNITVAAVNKGRQRLKKKLGLSASEDLTEFIMGL
jgi:DNA-binding NarL/FixJ family response regulator